MKQIIIYFNSLFFLLFLFACNEEQKSHPEIESNNSGTLTVLCDDAIYPIMEKPFNWYKETFTDVKLTTEPASAREIMRQLLAGKVRVCVISRDYLPDEDSLMKVFKVEKHVRMPIADDAVVFYVKNSFLIDSLNDKELYTVFTHHDARLSKMVPSLNGKEPVFAISGGLNSSLYVNFKNLVAHGEKIEAQLKFFSTYDSVAQFVENNDNAIGIGYLSYMATNTRVRGIPIGFTDTSGKYIDCKPVHQGYLVQGLIPFKITHYVYVLEDRKNLPFWFATFLGKEKKVQQYMKDIGIVPSFARFNLIPE